MATQPLIQPEFRAQYEAAEMALINWIELALDNLPPAYIHLMLSFRVHDFLNAIKVSIPEVPPEDNDFDPRYDTNKEPGEV